MYRMAVFDLDGTLLNDCNEISNENLEAIKKLQKQGCKIGIASGRPEELIKEYIGKIPNLDFFIACNGAIVKDINSDRIVIDEIISQEIVEKIIEECKELGCSYLVYTYNCIISTDNYRVRCFEKRNKKLKEEYKANFIKSNDPKWIARTYQVHKILIIEHNEFKFKKIFNDYSKMDGINITESFSGFMDIMATGVSKKKSLQMIVEQYGFESTDVVAFGDNYNDLEMLEYVGCSITTENSVQKVKDICDFVSKSNDKNGVAYAIDNYLHI